MPYKEPGNINFLTIALMTALAFWGGLVSYLSRIRKGGVRRFSFVELVGELVISGFSGVIVYLLCVQFDVPVLLTAATVAIAGHAGGRTVFFLEEVFNGRLEELAKRFGANNGG